MTTPTTPGVPSAPPTLPVVVEIRGGGASVKVGPPAKVVKK